MTEMAERARIASCDLALLDPSTKAEALRAMADALDAAAPAITTANTEDLAAAPPSLSEALRDRLRLTPDRIAAMAQGVRQIAVLPDPVGRELAVIHRPNGLVIRKVSVPLGVVVMIYESRPNVTADAAALCFKAGNAVILRGGSEALRSNQAILRAMAAAGASHGLPPNALQLVPVTDRQAVRELLQLDHLVDLVIPRGGESLIREVADHSRVPVIKHYKGICHVYVDRDAELEMAQRIAVNAKCQRPGVCNAMETLLVHEAVAEAFLPPTAAALIARGVELRGDERTCSLIGAAVPATEADWSSEYLDLILSVRRGSRSRCRHRAHQPVRFPPHRRHRDREQGRG